MQYKDFTPEQKENIKNYVKEWQQRNPEKIKEYRKNSRYIRSEQSQENEKKRLIKKYELQKKYKEFKDAMPYMLTTNSLFFEKIKVKKLKN
jgi:hypothetical protein